jgi:hypothetical protein
MARHVLGGPADDGRSSYQIALAVCAACGAGQQQASGELVSVDAEVIAMAHCDGQLLGHIPARAANQNAVMAAELDEAGSVSTPVVTPDVRRCTSSHPGAGHAVDEAHHHAEHGDVIPLDTRGHMKTLTAASAHTGGAGCSGNVQATERANAHADDWHAESAPASVICTLNLQPGSMAPTANLHVRDASIHTANATPAKSFAERAHAHAGDTSNLHAAVASSRANIAASHAVNVCTNASSTANTHAESASAHAAHGAEESPQPDGADVDAPAQAIDTAATPARVTVGPPEGSVARASATRCISPPESSTRAKQTIPPTLRRAVLLRDQHRCRVPGCRNTIFVDLHHIQLRSEGGRNELTNLVTLCGSHHRAPHRGSLLIEKDARVGVAFRHADGALYGDAIDAPTLEAQTKLFSALRHLGFREREVRTVLADLRADPESRGASVEGLLRQALRRLCPPHVRP